MTAPTKLILKKSSVANKIPQASDLDHGELAINFADGIIYYKNSSNVVKNFRDLSVLDSDIATSGSIIFEGSVADAHETTLTVIFQPSFNKDLAKTRPSPVPVNNQRCGWHFSIISIKINDNNKEKNEPLHA